MINQSTNTLHAAKEDSLSRAQFISQIAELSLGALLMPPLSLEVLASSPSPPKEDRIPRSGIIDSRLGAIEENVLAIMQQHEVPCAALALSKDGRIVINRAYGFQNPDHSKPIQTTTKFRLASLDKPITATAVQLLAEKQVKLKDTGEVFNRDLRIFRTLYRSGIRPPKGAPIDRRLGDLTVGHLLDHQDGLSALPQVTKITEFLGLDGFPTPIDLLRWHMAQPLRFDPGSKTEYSNAAYDTLRGIVQWVTGDFLRFMKSAVFRPAGTGGIGLTSSRPADREPSEVWYATRHKAPSVFPEDKGKDLPITDGGGAYWDYHLLLTATAEAVVRYLDTWYFGSAKRLRDPATGRLAAGNDNGIAVYFGELPGTVTMMVQRRYSLCNFALLLNHQEERVGVKGIDMAPAIVEVINPLKW